MIYTAQDYILLTLAEAKIFRLMRAKEGKPPLLVYTDEERERLLFLYDKEKRIVKIGFCPSCKNTLNHFSGNENMPSGLYCPDCNDVIYDEEGNILCQLEN